MQENVEIIKNLDFEGHTIVRIIKAFVVEKRLKTRKPLKTRVKLTYRSYQTKP